MTLKNTMLEAIKCPGDLRALSEKNLQNLADDLRGETIGAVAVTGIISVSSRVIFGMIWKVEK